MNISENWRKQGNGFYSKVTQGMAPIIARGNYEKALNLYYKAENTAANNMDDLASAKKNLGMTSLQLARTLINQDEKASLIDFYFKGALEKFSEAWKVGSGKGEAWRMGIKTLVQETYINIEDRIADQQTDVRIRTLESLTPYLIDEEHKSSVFSTLTLMVFELALIQLQAKNYKSALSYLKDCYFPVSEGIRFAVTDQLKATFELYQEDIFIQTCVAESLQALAVADDLFESTVNEEEVLNMDMLFDVIDWYRQVISLTRDKDIELEAIAYSRLGKIFEKVLKQDVKARAYYNKCIELANTLKPRLLYNEEWYREATDALVRYQQEDLRKEEEAKKGYRDEVLKKKKDELDLLKKNFKDMGKVEFLKFLYKTYPPKNKKHVLGKVSDTPESPEIKKLYQKAVIHFHPDKVDSANKEWKVMTEEIVKLLTSHYEYFKQCD